MPELAERPSEPAKTSALGAHSAQSCDPNIPDSSASASAYAISPGVQAFHKRQRDDPPLVWGNVPPRNPNFTGREELLEQLGKRLIAGSATAVLPSALHGMGGIGKTQMATEYIYRHLQKYDLIWWIEAARATQIRASLTELAKQLGLQVASDANTAALAVRAALRVDRPFKRWLRCFNATKGPEGTSEGHADPATDSAMPIPRFDPRGTRSYISPTSTPARTAFHQRSCSSNSWPTKSAMKLAPIWRALRRIPALDKRREVRLPIPTEPHLHLMFAIEVDSIDSDRCILSFWRQDDPFDWPPPRGGVREVGIVDLEYRVDKAIIAAESAWSDLAVSVIVEFLTARPLLQLPIYSWRKEHQSGAPRPLVYDYTIVPRSLERMQTKYWRRTWRVRWDSMLENPMPDRIHSLAVALSGENPIDAVLSDSRWIGLVMDEPPLARPEPRAAPEALTAALRAGLPVILWHPTAPPEDLRALVGRLTGGQGGVLDLPEQRRAAHLSADTDAGDLIRDLVVLWDDPNRTVDLDQQSPNPAGQ